MKSQHAERTELNVLVLGCAGVGKTLLLRHLRHKFTDNGLVKSALPSPSSAGASSVLKVDTQPTNGTDLQTITYGDFHLSFREVGSALLTKWPSYYNETAVIVYLVDSANLVQISNSWIELLNILQDKATHGKSLLIAMNKSDISDQTGVATLKSIMRMDDILQKSACRSGIIDISALTGMNMDTMLKMIINMGGVYASRRRDG